ncbi:MAG: hypothetical protein ACLPUO_14930 [Streptosporangiaceae bacterium]
MSTAPGAPVSGEAAPVSIPMPSPSHQTSSAQGTETARAARAVRGISMPIPRASCRTAKARWRAPDGRRPPGGHP